MYGGDAACVHEWRDGTFYNDSPARSTHAEKFSDVAVARGARTHTTTACTVCGAWRGELGWEPTPQLFVSHLVEVFAEAHRVLRDDGLLFVNLMDTRVGGGRGLGSEKQQTSKGTDLGRMVSDLKAKDMALVPERFVLAMQEFGWYVRSKIIWAKGESFNPYRAGSAMPESARDRPSDTFEMIFMFSKKPTYYSDMAAVAEEAKQQAGEPRSTPQHKLSQKHNGNLGTNRWHPTRNLRSVWTVPPAKIDGDVWRINTKGTSIKHYATWCPELAETMIRMSTSEHGVCATCGNPYERIMERTAGYSIPTPQTQSAHEARLGVGPPVGTVGKSGGSRVDGTVTTVGWRATCTHSEAERVPATVLDCFGGSGTTGRAAYALGRNSICIELQPDYHAIAEQHRPDVVTAAIASIVADSPGNAPEDTEARQLAMI